MPNKNSVTEKWSDPWFRKLDVTEKLLFMYLCDVCDCAGFIEYDAEIVEFQVKAPTKALEGALKGLYPKVVRKGNWLWVVNHIKHQTGHPQKPLKPANKYHIGIWRRLNAHLDMEEVKDFIDRMDERLRAGFVLKNGDADEAPTKALGRVTSNSNSYSISNSISKREEGGSGGKPILDQLEAFRAVHPECASVSEMSFVAAIRECTEVGGGPDVGEALRVFTTDWADAAGFRPTTPIREFKKYLRHSMRRVSVEQIEKKKKTSRRHPALGMLEKKEGNKP